MVARARPLLLVVLVLAVLAGCVVAFSLASGARETEPAPDPTELQEATRAAPVVVGDGGVDNVVFSYDRRPLASTPRALLPRRLGRPAVVVSKPRLDPRAEVRAIHSLGALAYRYVQVVSTPGDRGYDGIDLSARPDWAFCVDGDRPSLEQVKGPEGTPFYFLDANEQTVRDRLAVLFLSYRADGWDGLYFDRAHVATQSGTDVEGRSTWSRTSSCTDYPVTEGATMSDAFVATLELAGDSGLETMVDNGRSPFDARLPMRPDPADADCRDLAADRPADGACDPLLDIWRHAGLVVTDDASAPKDERWEETFAAASRSENDPELGRRTVVLLAASSLGEDQSAREVYYQWSRVKLFDLPVAVNTGDDRCETGAGRRGVCNRYGSYPELADLRLGVPLEDAPSATGCARRDEVRCLWTRRYADGMSVVNVSALPRLGAGLELGTDTCRHVLDVRTGEPLAGNRCVRRLSVDLPAWGGRPLRYSERPW